MSGRDVFTSPFHPFHPCRPYLPFRLEVQAGRLLCVSETLYPDGSRHIVNLVFRGLEKGGEIRPSSDTRVEACMFVDLGELPEIRLYPPLAAFLQRACSPGYRGGGVYLGRLWRD